MMRSFTGLVTLLGTVLSYGELETFPNTAPIESLPGDLPAHLMEGAHAFVEREIAKAAAKPLLVTDENRHALRNRLRQKLGVVDERLPSRLEFFSDAPTSFEGKPGTSLVASPPGFSVHQVRWDVLGGFQAEGLYVNPEGDFETISNAPFMVLIPDAGETPEDLLGLTDKLPSHKQMGLRFALTGFRMLIPATVNRTLFKGLTGDDPKIVKSRQTHREWLYRQGFQMGRHLIGYEVQSALAAADWFRLQFPGAEITVAGYGSGGRAALYAAAVDEQIDSAFISGAFGPRDNAWKEPIDNNIFGLLPDFNDAAVAALIFPRPLLIEHTSFPEFESAKGNLSEPAFAEVQRELKRTGTILSQFSPPANMHSNEATNGARGDYPSVAGFLQAIGRAPEVDRIAPLALMLEERSGFNPETRHRRVFQGIQNHIQDVLDRSGETRRENVLFDLDPSLRPGKWSTEKSHEILSSLTILSSQEKWRDYFHQEVIGEFDAPLLPLNPRSRKLLENERWTAWDILLDVHAEFEGWGVLLVPKGIKEGEKRPVVVCQHGRNGLPRDTIDAGKSAYSDFAAQLADQGFITFAPHNLYRGEDEYRWLDRKANVIGCSLFSLITASHQQFLKFLATLEQVDPDRIAFYGLSYGGETAMRVPALLPGYCLSICSGDFNQWTRKVADPSAPGSFMKSIEWEMPYWNLGNTFDYSEMAALIFPRPFFVERGHHDRVSRDEWVAHEYAKVRWLYAQYGLGDRTGIEFFQGGHSINGEGSFEFLKKHLNFSE